MSGHIAKYAQLDGADVRSPCAVGDTVAFLPSAFLPPPQTSGADMAEARAKYTLSGRVVYVNEPHRYYIVEAPCWGYLIREAFKF